MFSTLGQIDLEASNTFAMLKELVDAFLSPPGDDNRWLGRKTMDGEGQCAANACGCSDYEDTLSVSDTRHCELLVNVVDVEGPQDTGPQ